MRFCRQHTNIAGYPLSSRNAAHWLHTRYLRGFLMGRYWDHADSSVVLAEDQWSTSYFE